MINLYTLFNWFGLSDKYKNNPQTMNAMTANDYYDRLRLIALSLFDWTGLPDSCNARALEMTLYMYGRALFVNDPSLGFLNMKCTPSGSLNVYDEPVSFTAYGSTYTSRTFDRDESVLIRNNILERPTDNSVILFATRLMESERTIDVNIQNQKTPFMIRCDERDRLSLINFFKKYEDNETKIIGSKQFNIDAIKVDELKAEFIADKLQDYQMRLWNQIYTFFGINNANTDKRERLNTDEVNANNEQTSINAFAMYAARLEAAELINKMFDLKVSVKRRTFEEVMNAVSGTKEGEE